MLNCLGRDRVIVGLRLTLSLADLRMLWLGRIRRRFPVSELAGVATKAQNPG
jgi:hypothetical protein